jgi:acetylornithine deacetylase/succinyl-diaminopimelate desuccinylase-like protein
MRNHAGAGAARGSAGAFWTILITLFAYAALTHWLDDPPAPQSTNAPAATFSAQRAAGELRQLLGDGLPHPLASSADERIRTQLLARLAALGIPSELQSGWVCDIEYACGQAVNVVARLDGTDPASGAVLLAAHYDSVPAGPGAGDDGVGVASILEIARILRLAPAPRHPVILLID